MRENIRYYLKKNIWITTSYSFMATKLSARGNFNTKLLRLAVEEIGADRVLFSIDYPYDEVSDAAKWWKSVDPENVGGKEAYDAIGRTNAIRLLKLKV
jgi:predicted TIM-barrel fold metal-dependent hydrolase